MTETEERDLRAMGADLSGAMHSRWEPRCVARAFITPPRGTLTLTMQHWIELDAIRSPLLDLELPKDAAQLEAAARVFALSVRELPVESAVEVAQQMRQAVAAAFDMAIPMRPPHTPGAGLDDRLAEGFGGWLPMFSFLVAECHMPVILARMLSVGQAFALLAATRRNQGWICTGTTYAMRDAEQTDDPSPNPDAAEPTPDEPSS